MRNAIALVVWLMGASTAPALCQALPSIPGIPPAPEPVAIVTAAPEPVTLVTEAPATQAFESPAEPVVVPQFQPQPDQMSAWVEQKAQVVQEVEYNAIRQTEVMERQIFTYAPNDFRAISAVPEPGSILALSGGLSGMAISVLRRRKNRS